MMAVETQPSADSELSGLFSEILWKYHAIHIIRCYGPVHGPNYLLNVLES